MKKRCRGMQDSGVGRCLGFTTCDVEAGRYNVAEKNTGYGPAARAAAPEAALTKTSITATKSRTIRDGEGNGNR